MKKSLLAILVAAVVVLAIPVLAFANSGASADPEGTSNPSAVAKTTVTSPDGQEITVEADISVEGTEDNMTLTADAVDTPSATFEANKTGNEAFVATFDVNAYVNGVLNNDAVTTVTIVYVVDADYAGYTAIAYIDHSDGTSEIQNLGAVSADGKVTLSMNKLSTITLTLTKPATPEPTPAPTPGTDTGSSSPKTGGILF